MLLVLEPKRVTVDQLPYHCLPQLFPLAVVVVDPKEQMVQQAEMVVEADIAIMLEPQAQLEDSLAVMPMAMEVVEAEAQEAQELQEVQEEMVEVGYQVQFPETQFIMAAAVAVEVTVTLELVWEVLEAVVKEDWVILP
jgi:hypothetical protein